VHQMLPARSGPTNVQTYKCHDKFCTPTFYRSACSGYLRMVCSLKRRWCGLFDEPSEIPRLIWKQVLRKTVDPKWPDLLLSCLKNG
jgi:hypothetical protein